MIILCVNATVLSANASPIAVSLQSGFKRLAQKSSGSVYDARVLSGQSAVERERAAGFLQGQVEGGTSWTKQSRRRTSLDPNLPEPFTALGNTLFNNDSQLVKHVGTVRISQQLFDNGLTDERINLAALSGETADIDRAIDDQASKIQFAHLYFDWFKRATLLGAQQREIEGMVAELAQFRGGFNARSAGYLTIQEKQVAIEKAWLNVEKTRIEMDSLYRQIQRLLEIPTADTMVLVTPNLNLAWVTPSHQPVTELPRAKRFKALAKEADIQAKVARASSQYRIDADGIVQVDSVGNTTTYSGISVKWPILDGGRTAHTIAAYHHQRDAYNRSAAVEINHIESDIKSDLDQLDTLRMELKILDKERQLIDQRLGFVSTQVAKGLMLPVERTKVLVQRDLIDFSRRQIGLDMHRLRVLIELKRGKL